MAELREIVHGRGLHVVIFDAGMQRIEVVRTFGNGKAFETYIKLPHSIRPGDTEFDAALQRAREIAEAWAAEAQSEEAE